VYVRTNESRPVKLLHASTGDFSAVVPMPNGTDKWEMQIAAVFC
jgi:hypothetical protein